jgi:hypothetical protein
MLEAAQDNRHRDAFRAAHAARGEAVAALWKALFARRR